MPATPVAGWHHPIAEFAAPNAQTPDKSDRDMFLWQAVSLLVANDVGKNKNGLVAVLLMHGA